jgi:hypothetical protein
MAVEVAIRTFKLTIREVYVNRKLLHYSKLLITSRAAMHPKPAAVTA